MDEQVKRLAQKIYDGVTEKAATHRTLIGVAGIPGSGKTTLARLTAGVINERFGREIAVAVSMDGYHFTRAQLDKMPNPVLAHARRGAEFTFDGERFLALVRRLREPLGPTAATVYAPSFDHAVKDPKENDISILASHRVIIFEGNYVALDKEPWRTAGGLMDELWFVEVDFEVARKRLVQRHVESGIVADEAAADRRARENDLVNGEEIVSHRLPVTEIIISKEDDDWASM